MNDIQRLIDETIRDLDRLRAYAESRGWTAIELGGLDRARETLLRLRHEHE